MPAKPSTKKVRHVNGSQKGSSFEREIAKALSLWLSYGADPNVFWRTAGSGARSTQFAKKNAGRGIANQASDISAMGKEGLAFSERYIVECKFYKDIALWQLFFDAPNSVVGRWWAEAMHDARSVNKTPLLIVRGNLLKPLIIFKERCVWVKAASCVSVEANGMWVYKLKDFFHHVIPHDFLHIPGDPPCRIRPVTHKTLAPAESQSDAITATGTGRKRTKASSKPRIA